MVKSRAETLHDAPRRSFLAPPSLGGKLTLVNANFWVIALLLSRSGVISPQASEWLVFPFLGLMLFFSLPLATCVFLPSVGTSPQPSFIGIVGDVLLVIFNSFVWGYGLAWCIDCARKLFFSSRKQP